MTPRTSLMERYCIRFILSVLIVTAVFSSKMIQTLERYQSAFVELEISANQRCSARLFIDAGDGYQAKSAVRVRVDPSIEPKRYRFQVPAVNIKGLQLDPSNKSGRIKISDAKVLDMEGSVLSHLKLDEFKFVEGPVEIRKVEEVVIIDIKDVEKPTSRVHISDEIGLGSLRKGGYAAISVWVLVILSLAAALARLLRPPYIRRIWTAIIVIAGRIDGLAASPKRAFLIIVLWCGLLSGIVIFTVAANQARYYQNHSYFYDPVSYLLRDISLFLEVKDQTKLNAAIGEGLANNRYPLRTVPLILAEPSLLAHPLGHLLTGAPAFFLLLVGFSWTVLKRSASLLYCLSAAALLAALPWHFDCRFGLGAYWLDTVSAYFLMLAALTLINWQRSGRMWWIAGFAIFASCTVLSRYVSVAYLLAVCGPLFIFAILTRVKLQRTLRHSLVLPLLICGSIVAVLAIPYLIAHFDSNQFYYSSFGYALGSSPVEAFGAILKALEKHYFGASTIVVLSILLVIQILMVKRASAGRALVDVFGAFWVFISILLFQVFVIRTVHAVHQFCYIALLMTFFFVSPLPWSLNVSLKRRLLIASFTGVCAVVIGVSAARYNRFIATDPSAEATELKNLDVALADGLVKEGANVVWVAFFDEYGPMPAIEAYCRGGILPGHPTRPTFSVHEKYFTAWYPEQTPEEISNTVLEIVNDEVDVAVVLADTELVDSLFNNRYSKAVASGLANTLPGDLNWKEVFRVKTMRYGELVGYRNRRLEVP